jgi:tripartite-type tricarboxylate transporter receptor subunit TctC
MKDAPRPRRRRMIAALAATLPLAVAARWSFAQTASSFPDRPIRIVVPFAPGGPTDLMARAVGKAMQQSVGQTIIIENKPGGGGVIAMGDIARSPADGYSLVFPSILAVTNPALMPDYPFDTVKDFSGVTVVGFVPHVLVVGADFPARTLAEFVAVARQKPGALSYGSTGVGTSAHLEGAMFARRADLEVTHVPYRGAAPALQDLLGGRIQFMFLDTTSALSQLRAGKLRALAVAPAQRSDVLPDVPTVAEQGYPGFDVHGWYGLLVRSGTPAPIIDRLYREVKSALATKDVGDLFRGQGISPGGMSPTQFDALIRADLIQWKQTIGELGIKLQ